MELREFEIREVNQEERTVSGIAVPFGQAVEIGGYKEAFERGAFDDDVEATLFYGHDHRSGGLPIGKLISSKNTDDGYAIEARISNTPKGDEVYSLLKDGVLKRFSVGFEPIKSVTRDGVVVRTKAALREVSVVPMPAYSGAVIAEVREINNDEVTTEMENVEDRSELVADLETRMTDIERKFAVLGDKADEGASTQFRTAGEFLKALATGDESAKSEVRAYTGAVLADADGASRPAWVQKALKLVDENRPTINLFNKQALPASGNSVEYPFVSGTSGTVGVQAAEGDDLPYMEVTLDTATAPVKTYGGYSSLSRQAIERSDMAYLETVLRYQALQYAKATEKAVRDALVAVSGANTATLAGDDAEGWIDLVVDAAAAIEDNSKGLSAEFALVSRDVFKRLAHMTDSAGRPLFVINGDGTNTIGGVSVNATRAVIAGLPVVVNPALAANSLFVASREAVTVWENPGAPTRLQDENIINLTKDFSLYGYLAVGITNAKGIVKVDADLV